MLLSRWDAVAQWVNEANETVASLRAHVPGSLRQAQDLCRRYNQLTHSSPLAAVCPVLDLPLVCFLPGHETPLASVIEDFTAELCATMSALGAWPSSHAEGLASTSV